MDDKNDKLVVKTESKQASNLSSAKLKTASAHTDLNKTKVLGNLETNNLGNLKLFGVWDTSAVVVNDASLKPYININSVLVPTTQGKLVKKQFWKSKKPIVERLMNRLFVSGHKGKKHWRSSGMNTGKKQLAYNIVKKAFKIIEKKTGKNPVQVFIDALETGTPKEGVATIEYGGVRYPKAMDLSPQRRIDLVLRWMTQGAYNASAKAGTKKSIFETLAEEITATAHNDSASNTIKKKTDLERQAEASR